MSVKENAEQVVVPSKRSLKWLWISLISFVALLLVVYVGFAVFFRYHFGFNVVIDDIDASFKTPAYIQDALSAKAAAYQLEIEALESAPVRITADQIDLKYAHDGQVEKLLSTQNFYAWPIWLFRPPAPLTTAASVSYDASKLANVLNSTSFMDSSLMKEPKDAFVEFTDGSYRVVSEYQGTTLDERATKAVVATAIGSLQAKITLAESDVYKTPAVLASDPQLTSKADLFNKYVPFSVTYTIGQKTEVLDGNIAIDWVDTNVDPTGSFNEDMLRAWVSDFAWRHSTLGHEREITTPTGDKKRIDRFDYHNGGTYGWQVDVEAEVQAIKDALLNHTGEVREPIFSQRAISFDEQDWGNTYLEVDIEKQHLWYIREGEVLLETDIVTGLPSNSIRDTPTGVYFLFRKTSPQKMVGEIQANGRPEYEAVVQYCMWFTDEGHAAHDASWQTSFGGDVYTYNGSHGCLNMPPPKAAELYALIEIDTPVVIHY
ncbi:MAG: L,D-transpeptidase/peptidoglycan binding protein [Coriobacteriales bacterium]|nr:L,D-transpeptidase/peptidoglycan binding protein [Coriobacteriales bacterium]